MNALHFEQVHQDSTERVTRLREEAARHGEAKTASLAEARLPERWFDVLLRACEHLDAARDLIGWPFLWHGHRH